MDLDISCVNLDIGFFNEKGEFTSGSPALKDFNPKQHGLEIAEDAAVRFVSQDPWVLILFTTKSGFLAVRLDKSTLLEGLMLNIDLSRLFTLGTLVSRVSHEFNNILTGLSGHASYLHELLTDADLKRSAELLKEGVEKAIILTRELVSFSKPNSKQEQIKVSTFLDRLRLWTKVLVPPRISVEISDRTGDVLFSTDLSKLNQILVNLVKNSVEAISDKGRIKIEVSLDGDYLIFAVEDDGGGMSVETLKNVFKPFATTKESGTGLGCYICKRLVEQLGGEIRVSSISGKSSKFEIRLPNAAAQDEAHSTERCEHHSHPRVLLVDDDENVREVLRMGLEHARIRVDAADCCENAIKLAKEQCYDLAVVDIIMPGKSGLETALELRQIQPEIKFIVISGYSPPETIEAFKALGVSSFLNKPFAINELVAEIDKVLGKRER